MYTEAKTPDYVRLITKLYIAFQNIEQGCKTAGYSYMCYCDVCKTNLVNELITLSTAIENLYPFHSKELFRLKDRLFKNTNYGLRPYGSPPIHEAHVITSSEIRILISHLKHEMDNGNNLGFWQYIHSKIVEVSQRKFNDGHYADSVESAFKEIESKVKAIRLQRGGDEKSGSALMLASFGGDDPLVKICDMSTTSGKDIQKGYAHIFAGAMFAIRNPNAHENIPTERNDAIRELMLASMLMHKIDETLRDNSDSL